jgi:multimeric flavodoxin WrbA
MKITVFNGSPRAEKGNTYSISNEFSEGAKSAGAEVENIFLVNKQIKYCKGCFGCWIKTPGKCVIDDDMAELLVKFVSSDVVIFATPLYVDNVSGIMKCFMDRLIPLIDPHFEIDEKGECRHPMNRGKAPKIAVISNCGFPQQSHFQVLQLLFGRIARNMHSEIIAEIYRSSGEIIGHPPLLLRPLVWQYNKLLQKAGREVVNDLKLSEETRKELEKPLVSAELYMKGANKYWDNELEKFNKE